jgi:hypothetical protein
MWCKTVSQPTSGIRGIEWHTATAYKENYNENMAKASLNNLQKHDRVVPFHMNDGKVSGDTNSRVSCREKAKRTILFETSIPR